MKKIIYFIMVLVIAWTFFNPHSQSYAASQVDTCVNLLLNGDMENDAGWRLDSGSLVSQYADLSYSGNRSLLLGPATDNVAAGRETFSTAWQVVTLPEDVTTLSFWYRPQSGPNPGNDQQYAGLIGQNGEIITLFLNTLEQSDEWLSIVADVSAYAGQTLWVYFGVNNDGNGSATRMYVDEVTLCATTAVSIPGITAATPVPTPLPLPPALPSSATDIYTFDQLGFAQETLRGPFSSTSYRFGLPANWELIDGATVQLNLTTLGADATLPQTPVPTTANLEVAFNTVPLTSISLSVGADETLTLPIPLSALISQRTDGQHELELMLDSSDSCDSNRHVNLVVQTDSHFILPHQTRLPSTDLRLFPQPIFQESFLPETALLVIPDQPTPTDLQAAFTVAAGLGQLSNSHLNLSLVAAGQLTGTVRESTNLIFIGLPETLPMLNEITWPAAFTNGTFEIAEARPEDGIVQLAVSPWNSDTAVMLISGTSTEGLLKAAQSVSLGTFRVGQQPDLAIITAIAPPVSALNPSVTNKSLADLGYTDQELDGRSRQSAEYEFTMPAGYVVNDEAYIELIFSHSDLINYEQSGLIVQLNDRTIGSARMEDSTPNRKIAHITLPRSVIHTGINKLTVRAEMVPLSDCIDPGFNGIWLTLWSESHLSLPLSPVTGSIRPVLDLSDFPNPFDDQPTLRDVALVVPADDPAAWEIATQIAATLGDRSNSPLVLLTATFADQVSNEMKQEKHLIVVGKPTTLPLLAEMETAMPAPFTSGSNFADEQTLPINFRLPADTSVGYLELFPAPWNPDRAVLTVLGSDLQGLQWSGLSLVVSELRSKLSSNLAVIQDQQIVVGDRLIPLVEEATVMPTTVLTQSVTTTAVIEMTPTPVVIPSATVTQQPGWLVPAMIGSGVLMGLIVIGVVLSFIWQWRRTRL